MKRATDISIAALLLILLAPVLAVLAIAVLLDSGRPILFSQTRVGRKFSLFKIIKFRSMRACVGGAAITAAGDSRITRVGTFLRSTKLDELPQLWNVLRGDMSLVGPRPEIPQYVHAFADRYRDILEVRPGITDLASVEFRDEERLLALSANPLITYQAVVLPAKLDLAEEYLRRRGPFFDIYICWRTLLCLMPGYSDDHKTAN